MCRNGIVRLRYGLFIAVLSFAPARANASVVFSSITSIPSTPDGYEVCGVNECEPQTRWVGASFTPSANYSMTDAEVLINGHGTYNVLLYTDPSGLPGTEITQIGSGLTVPSSASYITATVSGAPIALVSGTTYWLVLGSGTNGSDGTWVVGGSPSTNTAVSTSGGASWTSEGSDTLQFQIDGDMAAPEPSSGWLLAGGVLLLAAWTRIGKPFMTHYGCRERPNYSGR
jgi:hypothetical protein